MLINWIRNAGDAFDMFTAIAQRRGQVIICKSASDKKTYGFIQLDHMGANAFASIDNMKCIHAVVPLNVQTICFPW